MSDQTTVETPATEAAPAVQLQLQDLMLAAQVVQLASQRGAIKAEEMEAVGGLYNRLVTFLQASGAIQPAPTATQPAGTEDAPAAE
jgi:hypothetical protein